MVKNKGKCILSNTLFLVVFFVLVTIIIWLVVVFITVSNIITELIPSIVLQKRGWTI